MRVALDLDGRELWSVPGSGAVAIGRGVVVTVEGADATLRLTAVGDPSATPSEPTGCRIEPGDDDDAEALRLAATLTDR